MFGYVLPVKSEMKVRDFETYRAVYCGVCKQLHKSYGLFSRFLLNYDLVLLAVTADALSGQAGELRCEGCFANPLARNCVCHNSPGVQLAADGLVMLSYHKLCDDLQDENLLKRAFYKLLQPFVYRLYKRANKKWPKLASALEEQMHRQQELEENHCDSVDEACDPSAKICEALFQRAGCDEPSRRILGRLGLFAGQIVYLLDAAEDYEEDIAHGRYNVFHQAGYSKEETVQAAQKRCKMAAGEIALCYNLLRLRQYKDILDNIFFLGLPAGIEAAGLKRMKRRSGHGQIERV